jgi:hypothetical protein
MNNNCYKSTIILQMKYFTYLEILNEIHQGPYSAFTGY